MPKLTTQYKARQLKSKSCKYCLCCFWEFELKPLLCSVGQHRIHFMYLSDISPWDPLSPGSPYILFYLHSWVCTNLTLEEFEVTGSKQSSPLYFGIYPKKPFLFSVRSCLISLVYTTHIALEKGKQYWKHLFWKTLHLFNNTIFLMLPLWFSQKMRCILFPWHFWDAVVIEYGVFVYYIVLLNVCTLDRELSVRGNRRWKINLHLFTANAS